LYLPRIGQVENMSVEGLFVHGGDLWRLNTPLSCLQPPQQGKTLLYTVVLFIHQINKRCAYQFSSLM
ncbi:hypothetical protein, partial [Raoultella ornithinolytica]|uniref:hypothetical protein n=1 Tax=Raoultella ornithinolytica TaxID=54291 RepID=UPI001C5571E6